MGDDVEFGRSLTSYTNGLLLNHRYVFRHWIPIGPVSQDGIDFRRLRRGEQFGQIDAADNGVFLSRFNRTGNLAPSNQRGEQKQE